MERFQQRIFNSHHVAIMAGQAPLSMSELFIARRNGKLDSIRESIDRYGIPENEGTRTDYLLLQKAIYHKHTIVVKSLLKANCRVKALPSDSGLTPLALAFDKEYKAISLALMKKGASIYVADNTRTTVLHRAAERGSLKMLKVAVDSKIIDVNLLDSNGKSALQILLEKSNLKHNKKYGKKLNDMISILLLNGASVNFKSEDGRTALHCATALKLENITRFILQRIENVNMQDDQGNTPLHDLLTRNYGTENDIYSIAKLFIDKGARIDIPNLQNVTVGHILAEKKAKYLQILNEFLERQCEVTSIQNYEGNTVLHILLKESAHLGKEENDDELIEEKNQFTCIVNWILSELSLENIQNSSGETPLYLAADSYHYDIFEKMLPRLENINVTNRKGEALLHILVKRFSIKNAYLIERLVESGADVHLPNKKNETPFNLAREKKNEQLLHIINKQPSNNSKEYSSQKNKEMIVKTQTFTDKSAVTDVAGKNLKSPSPLRLTNKRLREENDAAEKSARKRQCLVESNAMNLSLSFSHRAYIRGLDADQSINRASPSIDSCNVLVPCNNSPSALPIALSAERHRSNAQDDPDSSRPSVVLDLLLDGGSPSVINRTGSGCSSVLMTSRSFDEKTDDAHYSDRSPFSSAERISTSPGQESPIETSCSSNCSPAKPRNPGQKVEVDFNSKSSGDQRIHDIFKLVSALSTGMVRLNERIDNVDKKLDILTTVMAGLDATPAGNESVNIQ